MKKIGCLLGIMLVAAATLFAQTTSTADELAKWKQLYDSGAITESEYNAKKDQLLNGGTTVTPTVTSDNAFLTVKTLIEDDLNDNKDRIQQLSFSLTQEQKESLYDEYSKSAGGYFALNSFLGFGIGSFAQGDKRDGGIQLGFELGGIVLWALGATTGTTAALGTGIGFTIGAFIVGCVSPFIYSNTRNSTLKEVLGLLESDSLAIQPVIDPFDNRYGFLAQLSL